MASTQLRKQIGDYVVVTGTFVVQLNLDSTDTPKHVPPEWLSAAVDKTGVLRRMNGTTSRTHEGMQELQVNVEHRPAFGASPGTLSALLRGIVQDETVIVRASDVFHGKQRPATNEELRAELAAFAAEAEDITVPLVKRRQASDAADRLRLVIGDDDDEQQ